MAFRWQLNWPKLSITLPNYLFLLTSLCQKLAHVIAHFLGEQRRLLPGREMAAAVQLVPVNELGIETLGPTARRGHDLAGEDAASHREFDAAGVAFADDPGVLEIDAR